MTRSASSLGRAGSNWTGTGREVAASQREFPKEPVPLHGPKGPLDRSGADPFAILQLIDEPVEVLVNVGRRVTLTRGS
jgi:hypothetical protein